MKVLITGGAGFIGSHITDRVLSEGHEAVIVDNLSSGKEKNINPSAIFYKVDISDPKLEKVIAKERPDIICHHAAQINVRKSTEDPVFDAQVNILGTIHLLELARKYGCKHLIFASSGGAIYGEQEKLPADENHSKIPLSPYGITKLTGENYLYFYKQEYGVNYTALRYGNVYGPRQDPHGEAGVIAIFTQRMLRGEEVIINGTGAQTRDYVFVGDVVEANMRAIAKREVYSGPFNVGTGLETSVNQLFKSLILLTKSDIEEVHGPAKKGEQMRSSLDYSKIKRKLGWEPQVSLQKGLEKTVEYFNNQLIGQ